MTEIGKTKLAVACVMIIEEQDLVVEVGSVFQHARPTADEQQWLDDLVADVGDIKVTARAAQSP
jgi:hypothetical protein